MTELRRRSDRPKRIGLRRLLFAATIVWAHPLLAGDQPHTANRLPQVLWSERRTSVGAI